MDVENTRQEKMKLEDELAAMKSLTTLMLEEQQVITEKTTIEKDTQFLQADMKALKDKLAKLARDKAVIVSSLRRIQSQNLRRRRKRAKKARPRLRRSTNKFTPSSTEFTPRLSRLSILRIFACMRTNT